MSRTLVIAPQWIGDAVMSEPLLARLAARGEQLAVAALPWVAPVYRAMPQVGAVIELPFAHGRLDWAERRRVAAGLRGRFDTAYVLPNSLKSALIPWLARFEFVHGTAVRALANAFGGHVDEDAWVRAPQRHLRVRAEHDAGTFEILGGDFDGRDRFHCHGVISQSSAGPPQAD